MKKEPLISVIIPVYNGAEFIDETLKSAFSQTYSNIEIIVVDDGSTDHTSEIVAKYPDVHYIYQENQGVSVARNTAISAAKGNYIAFLDADDIWMPDKLTIQMEFMRKNPEIRIVTTEKENFMEPGTELPDYLKPNYKWETVGENLPSTMIVHRSVFEEIGYYSPEYSSGEDREWL
ncbi:MAG: glycosyltransferase family A protein [Balneolaceae bacterium]|nr:glycosyltransferase family A protein [Balneolaceae bacterium]